MPGIDELNSFQPLFRCRSILLRRCFVGPFFVLPPSNTCVDDMMLHAPPGSMIHTMQHLQNPGSMSRWLINHWYEHSFLSRHRSHLPGAIFIAAIACLRTSMNCRAVSSVDYYGYSSSILGIKKRPREERRLTQIVEREICSRSDHRQKSLHLSPIRIRSTYCLPGKKCHALTGRPA